MHNHFDKHLNVKDFILKTRPKKILEVGAGEGENTEKLLTLKKEYDFDLTVISDYDPYENHDGFKFIKGISYTEFEKLDNDSIDLAIIDTDHNYYTMIMEFSSIDSKMKDLSSIILHDVNTFYCDTGTARSYGDNSEYPSEMIVGCATQKGGLGNAVIDWLSYNRFRYRLVRWIPEGEGACILTKAKLEYVNILYPGRGPKYHRSPEEAHV